MNKDRLFLLRPDFADPAQGSQPFFCPDSALIEGLLSFYPQLREQLDVQYVEFPRPRQAIIEMVGADHQGCPVLVIAQDAPADAGIAERSASTGCDFCHGARPIAAYLHRRHGIGDLHS